MIDEDYAADVVLLANTPALVDCWLVIDHMEIWSIQQNEIKEDIFKVGYVSILLYGCATWTLTKHIEKKLDGNYERMLHAVFR